VVVYASICAIVVGGVPVNAATLYWDTDASVSGNNLVNGDGLGGSGNWNLSNTNWWDTTNLVAWPNTNVDRAVFSGPSAVGGISVPRTVTLDSGITANRLDFLRGGYSLTGGDLTLAGATPTLFTAFGETATIDSLLQGTDGFVKIGGGTIRLTNPNNTYTGTTTISGGILSINSNGALGQDSSPIIVTGSATRGFEGGALMLAGGYSSGVTLTRSVSLQGLGPVPAFGAALLSVGNNTITGTLSNGSGALSTGISSAGGRLTLTDVSLAGTAGTTFLTVGVGSSLTSVPGVGSYAVTGVLSGAGSFQKSGGGTLIVAPSFAAGYTGTFRIYSGSMRFESVAAMGSNIGTGPASTFDLAGDNSILELRMDSPTIDKNFYMRAGGSPTIVFDRAIGSSMINGTTTLGTLTYDISETLTLNGRNGISVTLATAPVIGGGGNTAFTNNLNGTLTFTGDFWSNANNSGARLMTLSGNGDTVIEGNILAAGSASFGHSLTKSGSGRLTINGTASTYTGNTTISGGILQLGNLGAINKGSATGSILLGTSTTTATMRYTGATDTLAKPFSLMGTTGAAAILSDGAGTLTLSGATVGAGGAGIKTLFLGGTNTGDNTFSNWLLDNNSTNTTGLAKIGGGTWVLTEPTVMDAGIAGTVTIAAPGSTATTTLTLTSGTTANLRVGQTLSGLTAGLQITGIIDNTRFTVSTAQTSTSAPAGTYNVNVIPSVSTATAGGTWSGPLTISNGTLKLRATNAASNIVPNNNPVNFNIDAYTANQAAGGVLEFIGVNGLATTEALGLLTPTVGMNTIRLTSGGGGAAANLTFSGLAATVGKGSGVNFDVANGGGGTVTLSGVLTSTATTLPGNGHFYINGSNFARSLDGVIVVPVYGTDAGFVTTSTALTDAAHNEITDSFTNGAATVSSLKISGAQTLTLSGNLTVNLGGAANDGGILQTGGSSTITGNDATVRNLTTGGAGAIVIRVDGPSDVLTLSSTVIMPAATTGGLTKNGQGTLVLAGANLQTGITSINEGTVQLSGAGRLSGASQQLDLRQGATLDLNGVSTGTATNAFNGAGLVTNTSTTAATFNWGNSTTGNGVFSGIIQDGAGVVHVAKGGTTSAGTFSGLNTYTGVTTIGGTTGLVSVSNLANIGSASGIGRGDNTSDATNAASLVFSATTGGLNYTGLTSVSIDRLFTFNGTAANSGGQIANASANNSTLVFNKYSPIAFGAGATVAQTLTLGGASTGDNQINLQLINNGSLATRLSKIGAGVWILGNTDNSYSGTTTIADGTLVSLVSSDDNTKTSVPNSSGLILGGTSTSGVFQTTGNFTRSLAASASAAADTVSWNTGLTSGGGGFAASQDKLVVAIGGLATPTALTWNVGGFMGTAATTTGPLVLNSTTALGEVEFRNAIDLNGGTRTITVNDNTTTFTDFATITGVISNSTGTGNLTKSGAGTLQLLGANTYNGSTRVTAGMLVVNSLGNSTGPVVGTSVGTSSGANTVEQSLLLGNASTTPGLLQYVGPGETSDRLIRINTSTGSTQIHADGAGAIVLTNLINDFAGAKTLFLRGGNTQGNMITSNLANNGGNLAVTVDQGATWILGGNNTYSGNTTVSAGALGAASDTAFGTGTLNPRSGTLFAHGGDRTIANAVTVASTTTGGVFSFIGDHNLRMTGDWGYTNTTAGHTITNGMTAGKTLTLDGNMVLNALTGSISLAFNGTGNTILNGSISTSTAFNVSLSYTGDGTFTFSGVNPTAGATTLNNANGTFRLVGAGKLGTGALTVSSGFMSIESVNQSVTTLTMGNVAGTTATINVAAGKVLSPTAITFSGTTTLPATITGAGTLSLGNAGISVSVADNPTQMSDMIWSIANLTGSGTFVKLGAGTLDISGITNNNFTGSYQVDAGAIIGLAALSNNIALNGGVYTSNGTFTRALGTGDNQVQWLAGGGGFAAEGGDLTVTISSAPDPLVWAGTPNFVPNNAPLIFGSLTATGVTYFTHNIDLNGASRTVSVVDNTAVTTDMAVLSGELSNGALNKTGTGILELRGTNTLTSLTVAGGTLQFSTVSNLGGGDITLAGRLQYLGDTPQSTNQTITLTGTGILDASGVNGGTITFSGPIVAGGQTLNLEGSGDGVINGLISQNVNTADLNKNGSGTWTINTAMEIGDNFVISGGKVILNAVNSFGVGTGDDLFIRNATLELGVNGALTTDMDDLNISSETAGGGIFDIRGTTGSSSTDIIIGLNPGNQGTSPALSGSIIDSVGGGSFTTGALTFRSGTISANLITTGAVAVGSVISADHGGLNITTGNISGDLTVGTTLTLYDGTLSGNVALGSTMTKQSRGTVTFSGNNTAGTGVTTINAGTVVLDHGTNAGLKLGAAGLTMNGGVLHIKGHATTPVVVSPGNLILGSATDLAGAILKIDTAGASTILDLGTITRNIGASLRFNPSSSAGSLTTTAVNTSGNLLGGWATYQLGGGSAQFATIVGGELIGLASTVNDNVANWRGSTNITDDAGFTGTATPLTRIHSLRFDAASGNSTVTVASGDTLDIVSGGILITNNVAAGNPTITGGRISAGPFNELVVTQDGAAVFTLASRMTGSLALTKTGSGVLALNHSNNSSSGSVRVTAGTLRLQGGGAIGDNASVVLEPTNNVMLDVVDSETIGSLSGGDTINYRDVFVQIAAGKTLTVNQLAAGTFYGDINAASGAATFTKAGAGTLTITDGLINLGTGGVINVNAGRLALDVNGDNRFVHNVAAGTTVNVNARGSLFIDHNGITVATALTGGRIADDVAFNLYSTGSTTDGLYFRNDQNIALTEIIGTVTFGAGVNSVRVDATTTAANTTQNTVLRAASVIRANQATLVLRGVGIQASSNPRSQFQNASVMAGFGAGTGTSLPVIPWAIGPAAGGAVAADSFVTTAGTANAGWRPLNLDTEYALIPDAASWKATLSTQNVLVSTTLSGAASGKTVRSLLMATAAGAVDLTGDTLGALTVDSGGFLFSGTGSSTISGFTGIAVNPSVNEYVFHVMGSAAAVNSQLISSGAKLTKSGPGLLVLGADNAGLGSVALNEGFVQIDSMAKLGSGPVLFHGGGIKLAAGFTGGLNTNAWNIGTGGGSLDVALVTGGFTLVDGIDDSTAGSDDTFTLITRATGSTGNNGMLTIQGASSFTGLTVVNQTAIDSAVLTSVLLNGVTNQAINGNLQIGVLGAVPNNNFDVIVGLGADEQIVDTASITFNSTSGEEAYFKLFGHTETIAGIAAAARGVIENHESATDSVADAGKLIVNSSQDFSYTGFIRDRASGTGGVLAFEKQGTGTQSLIGASITYTGDTTISGGTLHLRDVSGWASNIVNNSLLIFEDTTARTHIRDVTGTGSIVKQGAGSLTFSGGLALTYQGATTVEGGTMTIGSPLTASTVLRVLNNGSTLALTGGITNASAVTSIVVENGGILSLLDGAGNKFTGLTNLQLGSVGGTMTTLNLNVGDGDLAGDNLNTDLLSLLNGGTLNLFAGNQITLNLTDIGLNPGRTYNLITAADGGLTSGPLGSLDYLLGSTPGGFTSITINRTDTSISITTGTLIVGASYWTGLTSNAWNASADNWSTDKAGTTPAASIPGQGTDVVFVANSHAGGTLATTLEQNFKVNSLTFEQSTNTPTSVTISSGTIATSRLEVAPQASTDGVNVASNGPTTVTIAAPFKLGAAQTWNVTQADRLLTFSGALQGEADVTKTGLGRVVLAAAADPTFNSGRTTDITVSGGTLEMTNVAALGSTNNDNAANVVIGTGAAFYYNNTTATTALAPVAIGLTLTGGTLSLGGAAHFYGGATNVSGDSFINLRGANSATTSTAALSMTLSGVLSGSGNLTVDSNVSTLAGGNAESGTLTLTNNANTWNGDLIVNSGTVVTTAANGLGGGDITFNALGRIIVRGVDGTVIDQGGTMNFTAGALGEFSVDNIGLLAADFVINQNGQVNIGSGGTGATARFNLADVASTLNITGDVILGGASSISVEGGDIDSRVNISGVISDGGAGYALAVNDDAQSWAVTNGIVRLTGLNTFSGNVALGEGTLEFATVTDAGGPASSLGQGTAITMGASTLRFIGGTSQSTNRPITTTGSITLGAEGTAGAVITYAGAISHAADNSLTLAGAGEGRITGGITQPAGASSADLVVAGGTWTIRDNNATIADDLLVNAGSLTLENMLVTLNDDVVVSGPTSVLNLNSTGVLRATNPAGTSSGLFMRNGGRINLNADDIYGVANSGGLEYILLADGTPGATAVLNMNSFNISVPRLDVGSYADGLAGDIIGSGGTLTLTGTASDYSTGARLWRGTISANLAGNTTLWKLGTGSMTLSGDNTNLTGAAATRVEAGELVLDYTTHNTPKIATNVAIDARGGHLRLIGNASADSTQTVTGLTVSAGSSRVSLEAATGRSLNLTFGAVTRNANGAIYFRLLGDSVLGTTNPDAQFLGGWAAVNNTFAAVVAGRIVAAATTTKDDVSTWAAGDNLVTQNGYTGTVGTLGVANMSFDSANASTVTIAPSSILTLTNGGLLMTDGSGAALVTGGQLSSGLRVGTTLARELVIHQQNGTQTLTIASSIDPSVALLKAGVGTLVLSGSNNLSSRSLYIGDGTVRAQGGNAIGDLSLVSISPNIGVAAVFDITDSAETIGGLTGGTATGPGYGSVVLGATGALTLDGYAANSFGFLLSGGNDSVFIKNNVGVIGTNSIATGFTGHLIVNGGGFRLDGNTSNGDVFSAATAFTINGPGSHLISDQDATSNLGLIANGATVTLANTATLIPGAFAQGLIVTTNQNGARAETVGQITSQTGHNTLYANTAGGTNAARITTLTMAGLSRQNRSTILLAGQNLGAATGPAGRIVVTGGTPANLGAIGGAVTVNTTTISIIPYVVGEAAATAATETGLYSSLGNSLVTYDANGFRPLNLSTEYVLNENDYNALSGVTAHNVRFALNPAAALTGGSKTINSLVLDSSTTALAVSGDAADVLTLASGTLLATTTTAANGISFSGFAELRTATTEYIAYVTNAANTFSISSALTSTASLIKSGHGTLALTNSLNSYNGGTWFNLGLIEVSNLNAFGSGNLNFYGGGIRWATGATFDPSATSRLLTFGSGGAVFDTNGNDVLVNSSVGNGGTGGLTKLGEGTLIFNAPANFGGRVTIAGGNTASSAIIYGVANALPSTSDLALGMDGGTVGGWFSHGAFTTTLRGLNLNVNSTIAGAADLAFTGRVEIHGSASRTLTIINSGLTTFNGDFLAIVDRGGTARTLTLAGSGNVVINNEITDGAFTGALAFTTYTGTATLNGANTYTGATTINPGATGTIVIGHDQALGLGAATFTSGTLVGNGTPRTVLNNVTHSGTFVLAGTSKLTFSGFWLNSAGNRTLTVNTIDGVELAGELRLSEHATTGRVLTINGTGDVLVSGPVTNGGGTGAGSLTYSGDGDLTLTAFNAYTGTTTLNSAAGLGKIVVAMTSSLSSGPLVVQAGTLELNNLTQTVTTLAMGNGAAGTTSSIDLNGGILSLGGNVTYTASTTSGTAQIADGMLFLLGNRTFTINDSTQTVAEMVINATIADGDLSARTVTKLGDGSLTFGGANSYSGTTTLNAGILQLAHNEALGSATGGTTISGDAAGTGVLELTNNITVTGETLTIGARAGASLDIPHLRNASGNNTWAGAVNFSVGGTGTTYNLESAAGLLTISGQISGETTTGARTLQLRGAADGIVSGNIVNGTAVVALAKDGTGHWTVSGNNSYSGATNVNEGVLTIDGTHTGGGAVIVGSTTAATLNGAGSISGPMTVNATGTFSAGSSSNGDNGNGVGTFTIDSATGSTWISGASFVFDFAIADTDSGAPTNSTSWDYLNFNGAGGLSLDATGGSYTVSIRSWLGADYGANAFDADETSTIDLTGKEPNSHPVSYRWLWADIDEAAGGTLTGYGITNGQSNGALTQFTIDTSGFYPPETAPTMGGHFWVSAYGNDLYLNYSSVPEPGSLLLVGLAGLGFAGYRRRKRRQAEAVADVLDATPQETPA
jgi:autotransporter-associated beta strand protein